MCADSRDVRTQTGPTTIGAPDVLAKYAPLALLALVHQAQENTQAAAEPLAPHLDISGRLIDVSYWLHALNAYARDYALQSPGQGTTRPTPDQIRCYAGSESFSDLLYRYWQSVFGFAFRSAEIAKVLLPDVLSPDLRPAALELARQLNIAAGLLNWFLRAHDIEPHRIYFLETRFNPHHHEKGVNGVRESAVWTTLKQRAGLPPCSEPAVHPNAIADVETWGFASPQIGDTRSRVYLYGNIIFDCGSAAASG